MPPVHHLSENEAKKFMRYLETGSTNPAFNLAFEEYILTHRMQGDYLLLWQNDSTIVIGQNQSAEAEINRSFVEQQRIRVVRRSTGGGAVYHDLGNLNYSFITDAGDVESLTMARFANPVVTALKNLGLQAEVSGRNDILINKKKISGTAQRIYKNRILHHGTLLFDTDFSVLSEALRTAPEKYQSRGMTSVKSRVGNIREMLPRDMTMAAFKENLREALAVKSIDNLSDFEMEIIEKIKKEKYDTWEWNFGHAPHCKMLNRQRWPGGILDVHLNTERGKIKKIEFFGDFLSATDVAEVQDCLQGCDYRHEAVAEVLESLPIPLYFGTITKEEVLSSIFDDTN